MRTASRYYGTSWLPPGQLSAIRQVLVALTYVERIGAKPGGAGRSGISLGTDNSDVLREIKCVACRIYPHKNRVQRRRLPHFQFTGKLS